MRHSNLLWIDVHHSVSHCTQYLQVIHSFSADAIVMSFLVSILYILFAVTLNVTATAASISKPSAFYTVSQFISTTKNSSTLSSFSSTYGASSAVSISASLSLTYSLSLNTETAQSLSFPSSLLSASSSNAITSSAGTSSAAKTATPSTAPFPITASPFNPFKSSGIAGSSGFPITSGSSNSSNASINAPFIEIGCTPIPTDPWHDAASCSCQSEVYSWYATQSTGELTTTVCYTSGQHAYGYYYSPGCSPTTETLLATSWTAPDRCCGYCDIDVPTVRIVFWAPPATVSSNFTTKKTNYTLSTASTVVENGFTFTSPSVYVIYSGAIASASCVAMTETYHQVGGVHTTTMGYNSADLSSIACINSLGSGDGSPVKWVPINYADLYAPIPASESSSRVAQCFTDPSQAAEWGDYMQNPYISLPQDISNADPLWSTCSAALLGAMDPPSALTAAVAMVPVSVGQDPAQPGKATTTAADPVQTAVPGQPMPMPAPAIVAVLVSASELVNTNSTPVNLAPGSVAPSDPSNLQFGSGPENANPNDMSPTQLSMLHQALNPSPNPISINAATSSNAGQGTGNAPGNTQAEPEAATVASNESPNIQLQPIAAAIFSNQQPGNNEPQNSSPGAGAPQENNDPPRHNEPPGGDPPGNPTQYSGIASPAPPGQGVPAGPPEQAALTRGPNGGLTIGSSTIMPGQAATINNHQVSVGSSNVVVDSNTYAFAPLITPPAIPITVAGLSMQTAANGGVIIASQTLAPGIQTTIGGHAISVGAGNVVVDGNTQILPIAIPAPPPQPLIGGSTMQRVSDGAVMIGGSTLPIGSQATIAGHVISVDSANVVVDGTTNALPTPATTAPPILLNGQIIQRASNGGLIIGTSTVAPGSQTTIAGHVISVGPNNVVLDSSAYALPAIAGVTLIPSPNASAQRNAITLPNGSILSAGGSPVTISGETISILSNDQGAVIDGSTILFASPTAQSVFTVGGQIFTAAPSSFVVGGATVSLDGAAVTIAGMVVSLGPSGLQIGSMTIPLATAAPTGLGGYIVSAFEAPATAASSTGSVGGGPSATGVKAYTGSVMRLKSDSWLMVVTVFICLSVGMVAALL
ncbi:hypothetical protein JMJ35_009598 [Cladonia borealis]|uniref:Uncharacterized protein n=1 Tax=Cladonia borealis TaxID=184061 RepID=A0AA39QTN3_9LECA|nr:hypothetical protein JMJ35_009598 [Cladonia borealis]